MCSNKVPDFRNSLIDSIVNEKICIWNKKVQNAQLENFKRFINAKYAIKCETYWDLHKWSIKNYSQFWEEILIYFDYIYTGSYEEVARRKSTFMDIEWFPGAKMNYAENLLRHRDNKIALICLDEEDNEEIITYSQLYIQAKMYAAAFKRHGLQKGDVVANFMQNCQEAVFAMLGATILGAISCSAQNFSSMALGSLLKEMNPKFVITMSIFNYKKKIYNMLETISTITNELESLEKIIFIPTKYKSVLDISKINKSCMLQEFLDCGKDCNGTNDEISFLQLPFNHPISITFTSGTTGTPKGLVHSAATLLPMNRTYGLHFNVTEKDVIFLGANPGWISWKHHISNLMFGAKFLLYDEYCRPKTNYWELISKYKLTYISFSPYYLDLMEKNGVFPGPGCNFQNLRLVAMVGSPVKLQNYNYILQCVKQENVLIGITYGATETHGSLSGFDMNMPIFSGQIQVPALGIDLRCFDEHGNSIIGKRGELVIATPLPNLPLGMWNDEKKERFKKLYFSKYSEVWIQHDEGWIDPETKGIIVLGRSDDIIKFPSGTKTNITEIYFSIHSMEELDDYLCFAQNNSKTGYLELILFVKLKSEYTFSKELVTKIQVQIKNKLSVFHVPEIILEVQDIPYNLNNKRMERLVKQIVATNDIPQISYVRNPECLKNFINIPELQNI